MRIDEGMKSADALEELAAAYHKDARHIARLVAENKRSVGETEEERVSKREWAKLMHDTNLDRFLSQMTDEHDGWPDEQWLKWEEDGLDALIQQALRADDVK